jgi:hypothetical protein
MEEGQASACFSAGQAYARRALQFGHLQKVMLGILRPVAEGAGGLSPAQGFNPGLSPVAPSGQARRATIQLIVSTP